MKVAVEIRVAFLEQLSLMSRTHAAARSFAVACVQLVDDAHAFYDLAQRCEAHRVEARLIARVDVNLRRTSVWAGHSKRERPSHVAVLHGIVGEPFVLPNLRNHGIARNAELRESAGNHAEEPRIIIEAYLDEMVEAIGAAWRERPGNTEHDDALCGFNAHAVHTRRRLRPKRVVRIMQSARTLLGCDRLLNCRKQRCKRNENRQKDESSHIARKITLVSQSDKQQLAIKELTRYVGDSPDRIGILGEFLNIDLFALRTLFISLLHDDYEFVIEFFHLLSQVALAALRYPHLQITSNSFGRLPMPATGGRCTVAPPVPSCSLKWRNRGVPGLFNFRS